MTANELLSLLGRAWSRLLFYPGGLSAFGLIWLVSLLQNREPRSVSRLARNVDATNDERRTTNDEYQRSELSSFVLCHLGRSRSGGSLAERLHGSRLLVISSIAMPWLALALLPLPLAVALPRQIDIVIALALLEWPNLLAIGQELRVGGMRRLATALNSYPPLILATLALAQAANSLEITALARAPGNLASVSASALHWLGAVALALALPPALGIGPFADEEGPTTDDRRPTTDDDKALTHLPSPIPHPPSPGTLGLRVRALGLVALAALPWARAEGTSLSLLRLLGAAALIATLLWGFDRLTRKHAARRWAWAYLALDATLLVALLWAAYTALRSRLA